MRKCLVLAALVCTSPLVSAAASLTADRVSAEVKLPTVVLLLPVVAIYTVGCMLLYRGVRALQFVWQVNTTKPNTKTNDYIAQKNTTINTLLMHQLWQGYHLVTSTLTFAMLSVLPLLAPVALPYYLYHWGRAGFIIHRLQYIKDAVAHDQPVTALDCAVLVLAWPFV